MIQALKKTFFTEHLKPGEIVAINLDDEFGFKIFQEIKKNFLSALP